MEKWKKGFALILIAAIGTALAGCGDAGNETKLKTEAAYTEKEERYRTLPTEMMTPEETLRLTAGTKIELEDLEKMPDEAELEKHNLMIAYVFNQELYDEQGNFLESIQTEGGEISEDIRNKGYEERKTEYNQTSKDILTAIKIYEFVFTRDPEITGKEDGTWYKWADDAKWFIISPVVSKDVLAELDTYS